jgi:hypothetical protein
MHAPSTPDITVDAYASTRPAIESTRQDPALQTDEQASALQLWDGIPESTMPNWMSGRLSRDIFAGSLVAVVKGEWKGYTGKVVGTRYTMGGSGLVLDVEIDRTYQHTRVQLPVEHVVDYKYVRSIPKRALAERV